MKYIVTEYNYQENAERCSDYDSLEEAKEHVDGFYKRRTDSADHCSIVAIQKAGDVLYTSPWEDPEYCRLMGMSKEEVVAEYMGVLRSVKNTE